MPDTSNKKSIQIETFATGPLQVNCSLVYDTNTKEALLIDPGGNGKEIATHLNEQGLTLTAIYHTHAHFDHILGTQELITEKSYKKSENLVLGLHQEDSYLYNHFESQGGRFGFDNLTLNAEINHWFQHLERIAFHETEFEMRHTPGHSPGSVTIVMTVNNSTMAFCGDVIFKGSIGRTDLYKGDYNTLMQSIHEQILTLPDDAVLVPGHGELTTVGEEKRSNPFILDSLK